MTVALEVVLGHGAGGTEASMAPYVEGLARRGVRARAAGLRRDGRPVPKAELAVPRFLAAVGDPALTVAGGRSYGARVAGLAESQGAGFAGLLFFNYPLHRPGHPEIGPRVEHWARIRCPALFLAGARDPFASEPLLRQAVRALPRAELVLYPGVGHELGEHLEDALDRAAEFVRSLERSEATSPGGRSVNPHRPPGTRAGGDAPGSVTARGAGPVAARTRRGRSARSPAE